MIRIRSALFVLALVLGILLTSLVILLVSPITTARQRRHIAVYWSRYNLFMLRWLCGLGVQAEGLERLPQGCHLVLSKHQSAWETMVFHAFFPNRLWVMKDSLRRIPVFGWAVHMTGQIFIDRDAGVEAMRTMRRASAEAFQRGDSMILFPEGTRVDPGVVGPYKPGGVGLALAAQVPMVPVALDSGLYWPARTFRIRPGVVRLRVGTPIATAGYASKDRNMLMQSLVDAIESMQQELIPSGDK
ncbi:MAG: 1-acyl-sn-glycerol-3-phosphate acyltransferase [Magnetococcus sp. WYHC-3]